VTVKSALHLCFADYQGGDNISVMQFRVTLKGAGSDLWRMVQVLSSATLSDLHGVIQVSIGWDSIHLYQFKLETARYGSWETGAASPAVKLRDLNLSRGSSFIYDYDMLKHWEHEICLVEFKSVSPRGRYPACVGGIGKCPGDTILPQLRSIIPPNAATRLQ
jgi:hypothetical protein